jgi:osmoprotectant transport system ATP-binding protein
MLRLESVTKQYADQVAVDHLSFTIDDGQLCVLVGPSGCGKTTTLKMINRLIEPTSGQILLDGTDVTTMDAVELRRGIGYVIQQVGLFPHWTVAENVATVPRLLHWNHRRVADRVEEMLALVGLDPARFAQRYPRELSGGQRQRAGVARALAADPPVLLMDEPFGSIDPITRDRLQGEFLRLQRQLHKTVVFVTHDIDEAVRMGDRIALLAEGGRLQQYDTPAQILGSPATDFVADFVGADRGLRRLSVTSVAAEDLEHPPVVVDGDQLGDAGRVLKADHDRWAVVVDASGAPQGWITADDTAGSGSVHARVRPTDPPVLVGSTLRQALSEMLQHDTGWVPVVEDGRYVGVLTPESVYAALRRSVDQAAGSSAAPGSSADGGRAPEVREEDLR